MRHAQSVVNTTPMHVIALYEMRCVYRIRVHRTSQYTSLSLLTSPFHACFFQGRIESSVYQHYNPFLPFFPEVPNGDEWIKCSSLKDFVITYFESDNNEDKTTNILPKDSQTTTIRPLEPCTSYEFQIQATNKHGDGVMSPPESAITDPVGKSESNKWYSPFICSYCLVNSRCSSNTAVVMETDFTNLHESI